jgi:predicted transcriptional regulator
VNSDANRAEARLNGHLRDARRRAVILHLLDASGGPFSINQVACNVGMPFNLLKGILVSLKQDGFVDIEVRNGRYRIRVCDLLRQTHAKQVPLMPDVVPDAPAPTA